MNGAGSNEAALFCFLSFTSVTTTETAGTMTFQPVELKNKEMKFHTDDTSTWSSTSGGTTNSFSGSGSEDWLLSQE